MGFLIYLEIKKFFEIISMASGSFKASLDGFLMTEKKLLVKLKVTT